MNSRTVRICTCSDFHGFLFVSFVISEASTVYLVSYLNGSINVMLK